MSDEFTHAGPQDNPYVGPRAFGREDAHRFFGREAEANDLARLAGIEQVIVLYGASSVGKSSLVFTRLLQSLEAEGFAVSGVGRVTGVLPPGIAVQEVENIFVHSLLLGLGEITSDPASLAHTSITQFLTQAREADKQVDGVSAKPTVRVLIVDQFEEIFTAFPERWQDREDFFQQLGEALSDDPFLSVILTLREDYLAELDAFDHLIPGRLRARYRLERMRPEAAVEAVRQPAALYGRPFETAVAEALVDDLRQIPGQEGRSLVGQYVEPMQLQVLCYQLWQAIRDRHAEKITAADLAAIGNVESSLMQFYRAALADVLGDPRAGQVSERQLRDWFDHSLITSAGSRAIVYQRASETASLPNAVVALLQARFLVRAERLGTACWIELAHDRLIGPIRADNAAWFAVNQSMLERQASLWQEQGRPADLLLRGTALAEAEQWAHSQGDLLTADERDFLQACRQADAAAKREKSLAGMIRALAVVAVLVALVAIIAAYFGVTGQVNASQAAVQSRATAAYAQELAETAQVAAVAAKTAEAAAIAEAHRADQNYAQALALLNLLTTTTPTPAALATPSPVAVRTPTAAVEFSPTPTSAAAPSPTATPTATAASDQSVTATAAALQTISAVQTELALAAVQQQVAATPRPTTPASPTPLSWPPPGNIVFVSDRDNQGGELYIMRGDGSGLRRLTSTTAYEPTYTLAEGGQLAFSSKPDSRVSIYKMPIPESQLTDLTAPGVTNLTGFDTDNFEPAFSRDGQTIAFVSSREPFDWEIYVMNHDGTGLSWPPLTNDDPAKNTTPAWSPDGSQIVFVSIPKPDPDPRISAVQEIHIMNRDGTGRRPLTNFKAKSTYPAWSPDGKLIAFSSNRDGNMDIFVMSPDGSNLRNLTRSPADEDFPAWSLDGKWIAFTRWADNTEIFAMTADGRQVTQLTKDAGEDWSPTWVR